MRSKHLIREARRRAGLTQVELAERTGTTQSAVARWEAGGTRPSLEKVSRLVAASGLELRIGLAEPDPAERSLIERNLHLSPGQRLDQLVRTVEFIRAGRTAMRDLRD